MTPDNEKFVLCIDDTGTRELNPKKGPPRHDGMDWFGLGGVLVKGEEVNNVLDSHGRFCSEQKIDYPLHSTEIRCGRGEFSWLRNPEKSGYFMPALNEFLVSLPIVATAVIIHRPGYFARYLSQHQHDLWQMDKTAYSILIERAAKFADMHGRKLEVFFEQTGKREDRALKQYGKELKRDGLPFNNDNSSAYQPLSAEDFRRIILGDPEERTKDFALTQLADLVIYPIAKAGYDPEYRPYKELAAAGRLVDSHLPDGTRADCGIKYSCFDTPKRPKAQRNPEP